MKPTTHTADTASFSFSLILNEDPEPFLDALFEAGCDDALFGSVDGLGYGDFDREARSFESAVASAIGDVTGAGIQVLRVEPDDLVTAAEIAERLGRSRESIRLLVSKQRGDGSFPLPFSHGRDRNRLWRWAEVAEWAGQDTQAGAARFVAATNALLELLHDATRSDFARAALRDVFAATRPLGRTSRAAIGGVDRMVRETLADAPPPGRGGLGRESARGR